MLFFSRAEKQLIEDAIVTAETRTSAEIRVHLARHGASLEQGQRLFERLGMTATAARNGVLILLGVADRRFLVLGDRGIHERVPAHFWEEVAATMGAHFREDHFADGLVAGVTGIAVQLGHHFPRAPDDHNELPDTISYS